MVDLQVLALFVAGLALVAVGVVRIARKRK